MDAQWTSGNGPALAAAAKALNIAGATDDAKATALREGVKSFTTAQMNDFYQQFVEKVLVTTVFNYLKFEDPIFKVFGKEQTITAAKEVIDYQLIDWEDYDKSKKISDAQTYANPLHVVIHTEMKKILRNSVPLLGLRAAFASEQAYTQWVSLQVSLIAESIQVLNYEKFASAVVAVVENKMSAKVTGWDTLGLALGIELKKMEIPTVNYNMGFTTPSDSSNKLKVKKHISRQENMVLFANPKMIKKLESVQSLFIKTLDLSKFKAVIALPDSVLADTNFIVMEDTAFEITPRVNEVFSQVWGNNATIEYFMHFWALYGSIPWANGVHFTYTIVDPATADDKDTYAQPIKVQGDIDANITNAVINTKVTP